jgi:hypothetical protein
VKARNKKNWKKSLSLLTWNDHVGTAQKWETFVDGRGIAGMGNRDMDFVAVTFHHFVKDAKGRICRQENVA